MDLPWQKVLERPHADGHLVQVYQEGADAALIANVGRYLREGLHNGEAVIVVANRRHGEAFQREIGGHDAGQAKFFNSGEMLARLRIRGQPDWSRFAAEIGGAIQNIQEANTGAGLRVYGDMVNLLWQSGQYASAVRIEQFWNKLLSRSYFSLYCAYSIDIFGTDFREASVGGILATHTHLIPLKQTDTWKHRFNEPSTRFSAATRSRIREKIRTHHRTNHRAWLAMMPASERSALWLRTHLPERAEEILCRVRGHHREPAPRVA